MNAEQQPGHEKEIFEHALEIASPEERQGYVKGACGPDAALLARVQDLLRANDAKEFLPDEPAAGDAGGVRTPRSTISIAPPDEQPGTIIGRYKLLEKIGEGGFGIVYVAEQREPVKRRVALKIIKLGMDTKEVVARFEAERQALALMDHPNIAKVLDAGATEGRLSSRPEDGDRNVAAPIPAGRPYFVMKLVRGIRITDYCDQNNLRTVERLKLFIKVCHAIQHAHQKGIIHRDIKPSNILVTLHDGVPVPKVIDFGIAKATHQELTDKTVYTQLQQFIGTPAYISPEQAEMSGLDIDTRSDIYSLGVLLYELLTGQTPFDVRELLKAGLDELRRTIREKEPLRPSTKLHNLQGDELTTAAKRRGADAPKLINLIRGDIDWIVMKCLEKDRTRRYETANGLAKDIERYLTHEPVAACPPSTWYRLRKSVKRNRVAYAASAVVMAALVLGLGFSTWMFFRERAAEQEENRQRIRAERDSIAAREAARRLRLQSYAADMKLAQISLQENNVGRAVELLERWIPNRKDELHQPPNKKSDGDSRNLSLQPEEDLRGIEWRYLWQASRSAALHVFQHDAVVNAARLSSDGRWLATGSIDKRAHVWDVASRKLVAEFNGSSEMHGVAWSPDGKFIAVGETNRFVVRETAAWQVVHEWPGITLHVAWSPDGATIATFGGGALKLWNTANWQSTTLLTNVRPIVLLSFSYDGGWLAVGRENHVEVWDVTTQSRVHHISELIRPTSVALSPDKRWLAVGTMSGRISLWNLQANQFALVTNAHPAWVYGAVFSPDGKQLVTGGGDQVISFWETPTNEQPSTLTRIGRLKGHASEIWELEFSRDGNLIVSASKDGTARLWKATPQSEEDHLLRLPPGQLLGFSTDGRAVRMLRRNDTAIDEWSLRDGSLLRSLSIPVKSAVPMGGAQLRLVLDHDRAWIPLGDGTIELWDLAKSNRVQVLKVNDPLLFPVRLSADGRHLALRDRGGVQASLWNTETGQREAAFPVFATAGAKDFTRMAFSPDSRLFAYGSSNYLVKVWDIAARRELHTLGGHVWNVYAVAFSPDGELLATSSWDGRIRLWRVATGKEAMPPLTGHLGGVRVLHFTKDGRTLLAADDASAVRAWHVATGQELLTFLRRSPQPQGMASPDGTSLLFDAPNGQGDLPVISLPTLDEIDAERRAAR